MNLTLAQLIGGGGALSAGSSAFTAFLGWLRDRNQDKRLSKEAVEKYAKDLIETALKGAAEQMGRFEEEIRTLNQKLKTQGEECEARDRKQTAEIERLRAEIERLMGVPPADYRPSDLRRVGRKQP